MTRRRIIAGVILLAAVVVAVPLVPGVWERVAYQEQDTHFDSVVVLVKRWSWLPGRSEVFPDQLCPWCRGRAHDDCWALPARPFDAPMFVLVERRRIVAVPREFRCTCTDAAHDRD